MNRMSEPNTQLPVLQNKAPQELVVAQKVNALARLFQLKPKTLELVSKSTRQEGAEPGTFRVTSTNEKFKEMRAVILFEPVEQRELYTKGQYTAEAKQCFSLDNVQPHDKAKNPPAMYCASCPMGDINWEKWRAAKAKGITGDALSAYLPPCRKYWHLFIADRATKRPYYFNIKGGSVSSFESAMQNVAELFQLIYQSIKEENKAITAENAKLAADVQPKPLKPLPTTIGDVIWHISFTMYAFNKNGGPWTLGMKDFKVMSQEDRAEFGQILQDFIARKNAGQIQSQEASEAEEAEAAVAEPPAVQKQDTSAGVAQKNAQIQI
jgi:hypothetical protein